jgi:hypothetical protein
VYAQDSPEIEAIQAASGFECLRCAETRPRISPRSPLDRYLESQLPLPARLTLGTAEHRRFVDALPPLFTTPVVRVEIETIACGISRFESKRSRRRVNKYTLLGGKNSGELPDADMLIPDVRGPVDAARPVIRGSRELQEWFADARPDMPVMAAECNCGMLYTITAGAIQRAKSEPVQA